ELTIRGIVDSFTGCAGQRCMAASLMIAVGDVQKLIDQIVERARQIRLGADMGAIIDQAAVTRIEDAIGRAESDGAKILLDGRRATAPHGYENGHWLAPTIIDLARPEWQC